MRPGITVTLGAALIALALLVPSAGARLLPPGSSPVGLTYNAWHVKWLQAALRRNAEAPTSLIAQRENQCGLERDGAWLLATSSEPQTTHLHCVIPRGLPLVLSVFTDFTVADAPQEDMQQRIGAEFRSLDVRASLAVDGLSIRPGHRITTPVFTAPLPRGSWSGYAKGTWSFVARSYFAILSPLGPGTHTISAFATIRAGAEDLTGGVVYRLTVR